MKRTLYTFLYILLLQTAPAQNTWQQVGGGIDLYAQGWGVGSLYEYNNELVIGGLFLSVENGTSAPSVCRWDGNTLTPMGGGLFNNPQKTLPGGIQGLVSYKGMLYASGSIFYTDWTPAIGLGMFRWNGTHWLPMGGGNNALQELIVHDSLLYVCGYQSAMADSGSSTWNVGTGGIAAFDGDSFRVSGTPMSAMLCFGIYNDTLYAGGAYTHGEKIRKWDGTQWITILDGVTGVLYNNRFHSMAVYNGELYAAGVVTQLYGNPVNHIIKYNGSTWTDVGGGLNDTVFALYTDTVNNLLYAGGKFTIAGGNVPANYIAVWNGTNWAPVGNGFNDWVFSITSFNNEIYAGGKFTSADGMPCNYLAKWGCCLSIDDNDNSTTGVTVYPNPFSENTTIEINGYDNQQYDVILYDAMGKEVRQMKEQKGNKIVIDKESLEEGIYTYSIVFNSRVLRGKFIIY